MTNNFGKYFMVGIPGLVLDSSTEDLVRTQGIHNFIIFSRNVEGPDQLRRLCQDLESVCQDYELPFPFISIDQEGGTVARLSEPFTQFKDARILAESREPEKELAVFARTCARELADVGINMNLAPVLDICPSGEGFFMEHRSLGNDPYKVGELGCLIIDEMQKLGVAACGKHFPGLGEAKLDPHLQLPTVSKKHEEIVGGDVIPFQQAMDAGVAAIMTSHTIYSDIDDGIPATLSRFILSTMAREKLGYDGLIITDDLEMGAIENEGSIHEAAVKSFVAGADILLICHDHGKIRRSFAAFQEAVKEGVISAGRLRDSSRRIDSAINRFCKCSAQQPETRHLF
jgi:beta-N-acetylhexosaminidase